MGQDIKNMFEEQPEMTSLETPKGHQNRFESKLDQEFGKQRKGVSSMLKIAASITVLISLGLAGYSYLNSGNFGKELVKTEDSKTEINSMADISPDLKKVEDYYLNHIRYQLSKIKITDENSVYFEAYATELSELQKEYNAKISELNTDEISEDTIDALVENLQTRLKLMFQLKSQLKKIENIKNQKNETKEA